MVEEKNIRIVFTERADLVLLEIMKRYNLEENDEKRAKNLKEGRVSNIVIIDRLTKEFAKKSILEKTLVESLKKELVITQQVAERISKDIINNIVPLLERFTEEELAREKKEKEEIIEKPITATPIKPPIGLEKTPKEEVSKLTSEKPQVSKKSSFTELTEKTIPEKKKNKDIKTTKKEDIYREPIE